MKLKLVNFISFLLPVGLIKIMVLGVSSSELRRGYYGQGELGRSYLVLKTIHRFHNRFL